jgi:hypothetical protein
LLLLLFAVAAAAADGLRWTTSPYIGREVRNKRSSRSAIALQWPRICAPSHPLLRISGTDGGDDSMAMWEVGEGLTYPKPDTPRFQNNAIG